MKKITLLVASIFLIGGGVANAAEKNSFSHERKAPVDFRNAEPVVFVERGVEFYVFPDGQFDFNTHVGTRGQMMYRPSKHNSWNKGYEKSSKYRNENYGVRVEQDRFGRVTRVGNVMINYDYNDRIKRIGSVFMTYNRFALEQVGGLQIIYNRRGEIVDMMGSVKGGREAQYNQNAYGYEQRDDRDYGRDDIYYKNSGVPAQKAETRVSGNVAVRIDKRF